ncbi:hypothetical protein NDU88_005501 [Pleurodeles waltl]|uniref:Uncharacterized protein n=1 Tax=Pleurodeles waltl TaxID=8319 RepID=A0AAV7VJ63_PLEWA|nr:hypothetical protein NDU88_005501 [Pleurodeles waltl]
MNRLLGWVILGCGGPSYGECKMVPQGGLRVAQCSGAPVRERVGGRGTGMPDMAAVIPVHHLGAAAEWTHAQEAGIMDMDIDIGLLENEQKQVSARTSAARRIRGKMLWGA